LLTRRTALATCAKLGAAALVRDAIAQDPTPAARPKFGYSAPKRATPMLCVYSQNMIKVPYFELGNIAGQIGFEGVDLTVMPGGHVDPHIISVDLVRAFEAIRSANLEVPIVSTTITSLNDSTAYGVLYLSGHSQVQLFRMGSWEYQETGDIQQRLGQVRRDLTQVVSMGQRCEIAAMFANRAGGFVGQAIWDAQLMLADMDPRWVGYYFDPAEAMAAGGADSWEVALRMVLSRIKAVSLQDFYWKKDGAEWKLQKCPLGEGMVDWQKFFRILAAAHFTGPISIHTEYQPQDQTGAMAKDLEFARRQVQQAWPTS
jgi:L-ribulose-5-phosphate 3-epimerase